MHSFGTTKANAAAPTSIAAHRPLNVFVVEDTPAMQGALSALLSADAGFNVVGVAATEFIATQWLLDNAGKWDVVSLDLVLREGSGLNLLQQCKRQAKGKTIVVFSEFATDAVRERCAALGADAVFNKREIKEYADFLDGLRPS